jgi:hypothetical protein
MTLSSPQKARLHFLSVRAKVCHANRGFPLRLIFWPPWVRARRAANVCVLRSSDYTSAATH